VIINWWETIFTSAEQVIIFRNDNGATFGPILKLAIYGIIGEVIEVDDRGFVLPSTEHMFCILFSTLSFRKANIIFESISY